MRVRLTDQAAVAVALARQAAGEAPTAGHLLLGLATEPEGRAGRRLRDRATAAARLRDEANGPAPALDVALQRAATVAADRAATTVDLLDAAIAVGGEAIAALLERAGYQRDLDGWLAGDPATDWFEDAETYGLNPVGDDHLAPAASRVVAQVRAVDGGALEVLIAAAAAPDNGVDLPDPVDLSHAAQGLGRGRSDRWDAGLDAVLDAAGTLNRDGVIDVRDLVTAALVAGGDGPRLVMAFVSPAAS